MHHMQEAAHAYMQECIVLSARRTIPPVHKVVDPLFMVPQRAATALAAASTTV